MKTFVPFLFSLFALLLQSSCAGSAYTWKTRRPRYRYRNYRLVGHVINTIHGNVAIVTQCALACLRDDKCRSFNFFEHRRRCELNDRSHVTKARDKKWSRGCVYYARDAFSINTVRNHVFHGADARTQTYPRTYIRTLFYYVKY